MIYYIIGRYIFLENGFDPYTIKVFKDKYEADDMLKILGNGWEMIEVEMA